MSINIAIVGAGIIGITNAIHLLEKGFKVTVFSKDEPLKTNSDVAVATWFAPDDSKPLLQQLCLDTLLTFNKYNGIIHSGVQKIPIVYFFKNETEFKNSVFAKKALKKFLNVSMKIPSNIVENKTFPFRVIGTVPLIDATIYKPFLLQKCEKLSGKLKLKSIFSLEELITDYDIVINCAGWEAKYLTKDASTYPIRGQIEVAKMMDDNAKNKYSLNIKDLDTYIVFRPQSNDCVIGTTYKMNDFSKDIREIERKEIIEKATPFFKEISSIITTSKVGIRCGRSDVRIESEIIYNNQGNKKLIVHCYGHGGSGFSSSWGSAYKVYKHCLSYIQHHNTL